MQRSLSPFHTQPRDIEQGLQVLGMSLLCTRASIYQCVWWWGEGVKSNARLFGKVALPLISWLHSLDAVGVDSIRRVGNLKDFRHLRRIHGLHTEVV
jgi:hypothetical protein